MTKQICLIHEETSITNLFGDLWAITVVLLLFDQMDQANLLGRFSSNKRVLWMYCKLWWSLVRSTGFPPFRVRAGFSMTNLVHSNSILNRFGIVLFVFSLIPNNYGTVHLFVPLRSWKVRNQFSSFLLWSWKMWNSSVRFYFDPKRFGTNFLHSSLTWTALK